MKKKKREDLCQEGPAKDRLGGKKKKERVSKGILKRQVGGKRKKESETLLLVGRRSLRGGQKQRKGGGDQNTKRKENIKKKEGQARDKGVRKQRGKRIPSEKRGSEKQSIRLIQTVQRKTKKKQRFFALAFCEGNNPVGGGRGGFGWATQDQADSSWAPGGSTLISAMRRGRGKGILIIEQSEKDQAVQTPTLAGGERETKAAQYVRKVGGGGKKGGSKMTRGEPGSSYEKKVPQNVQSRLLAGRVTKKIQRGKKRREKRRRKNIPEK